MGKRLSRREFQSSVGALTVAGSTLSVQGTPVEGDGTGELRYRWTVPAGLSWSDSRRIRGSFLLRFRDDGRTWGQASLISRENHGETSLLHFPRGSCWRPCEAPARKVTMCG